MYAQAAIPVFGIYENEECRIDLILEELWRGYTRVYEIKDRRFKKEIKIELIIKE